jgi:hypothetical protein
MKKNDDRRRVVVDDVEPSAPPLSEMNNPAVAVAYDATPFPPPFAPPHRPGHAIEENYVVATPVLLVPPPISPPRNIITDDVDRRIERNVDVDGSLVITITTITKRRIDGHREVRIETYRIPPGDGAGWAAASSFMSSSSSNTNSYSVSTSTPGDAYLTRVEVQTHPPGYVLPPSTAADVTSSWTPPPPPITPPTTTMATTGGLPDSAGLGTMVTHEMIHRRRHGMSCRRRCCVLCTAWWGCVCVVVVALAIVAAIMLPRRIWQLRSTSEVGAFCGLFFDDAKNMCSESTRCYDDSDCPNGIGCWESIQCYA